ncbi:hypothetical protein [Enterobacter roggenkampii]|uniref:hypothetical protein n=1 Tax=Enterobacter roggenkampii TaxID=1812935 RepID=UPI00084CD50F|nr:hypothetical protein [Enterobacter roggenkampii]AOP98022.1 hypothetical protein BFV67_22890 [Enterobacter roggenkampii]QWZ75377.1 hypothetical protein I6L60_23065 [Enterobacter roggenkampii]
MMSWVIVDSDFIEFDKMFGHRKVTITDSKKITGSGHAEINKKKVCVLGDEKKINLKATYTIDGYASPGNGQVTITKLNDSQFTQGCISEKPLITEGNGTFVALFTPSTPAIGPSPANMPDVTAPTPGTGWFKHSQDWVKAG